jgi:N,N'-diacetyllegionaminate synthase
MREKIFIIAEAGVNHNGSLELAKKLVDVAVEAGADAVKFQTFVAEKGVSKFAPKAEYQKKATSNEESQLEMSKKLELNKRAHEELMEYCKKRNIQFLSTPFDLVSIDLLDELGLDILKIPSGEIINLPYLRKIGSLKKKLIVSTGMAELSEIKETLSVLVGSGTKRDDITVLHCNTEYPTPFSDANILAMVSLRNDLDIKSGYSDHTPGIEASVAAAALGATIIEKHFTLDKNMPGPDHKASVEPHELKAMVAAIRNVELALGDGVKRVTSSESKNKDIARKSIVASTDIKEGEVFSDDNLDVKRPGSGISPMDWDSVIGKQACRDFKADELIEL